MSEERPAQDFIVEDARIDALEERLKAAQKREEERNRPATNAPDANYRMGNKVLADLLGGILGGTVFGWLIDVLAETQPWGLMAGLFFGIVVAFRNVFRLASTQSGEPRDEA